MKVTEKFGIVSFVADQYLHEAIRSIDSRFGVGYAKKNPSRVSSMMTIMDNTSGRNDGNIAEYRQSGLRHTKRKLKTSSFLRINTHMDDKKAAKLIIRRRKKNPFLYTKEEVKYAKLIKRNIKDQENSSK